MTAEPLDRLRAAPLEVLGRIVESSNATFLVAVGQVGDDDTAAVDGASGPLADLAAEVHAEPEPDDEHDQHEDDDDGVAGLPPGLKGVYKPLAGERPLWDFPEGLFRREVAAYELAVALGWDIVPGTVVREDAPLGVGSLQRFVEADFARHYFVLRDERRHDDQLMRLCAFDLLANNTDRKGGHVLVDADDHLWGIDNGLCFSTDAHLRTVIWDYAGVPVPDDVMDAVHGLLDDGLPATVTDLLFDDEAEAVLHRARVLRSARQFPHDPSGRRIPWPLI